MTAWEGACPRLQCVSRQMQWLILSYREQAPSHKMPSTHLDLSLAGDISLALRDLPPTPPLFRLWSSRKQ